MLTERDSLLSYISDAHKDAYGFRPSLSRYLDLSVAELRTEADHLSAAVAEAIEEQREQQTRMAALFEARVADVIAAGAGDRATALRWIFDADGIAEDVAFHGTDYAEYSLGLPYGYLTEKEAA